VNGPAQRPSVAVGWIATARINAQALALASALAARLLSTGIIKQFTTVCLAMVFPIQGFDHSMA
jgi:hypothetical protein